MSGGPAMLRRTAIEVRPATGTRALFQKAGFRKAADTGSTLNGFPRVLMRRTL